MGASRDKYNIPIYLAMSTLIRIRNVYFSYRKSGVVSFFLELFFEKMEILGYTGKMLKKMEL